MFKLIFIVILSSAFSFADECVELFDKRGEDLNTTLAAYDCFDQQNPENKLDKAKKLNQMAYLKFFEATYFKNNRLNTFVKSYSLAEKAAELYGILFEHKQLRDLPSEQVDQIALAYYLYGTSLSNYVDIKGKVAAILNMSKIKKASRTILALKKPGTFHYGAYRNTAMFYYKVPMLAGGSMKKAKVFFEKLIKVSKNSINVSSYPVNHILYAEYLKEVKQKTKACAQLTLVIKLTDDEIEAYFKDLSYETKKDRIEAQKAFERYSC
jgi:hypothetical protein